MPSSAAPRRLKLDIVIAPRLAVPPTVARHMRAAALAAFEHLPSKLQVPADITLLIAGNAAVKELNHDFRGMDKPTNVLSFPQLTPAEIAKYGKKSSSIYLGDIAIAYPYVVDEAKKNNKILLNHLRHLMIHGLFHLFGYDHILDKDATRMEKLETKVMAALGLPDPYLVAQPMEPKRAKAARTKRRAAGRPTR